MADVRLTATNPEDSSVVPVACDASGRLLLEELPEFDGTLDGDLYVTGKGTFAGGKSIIGNDGSAQFAQGAVDIYANGTVEFTEAINFNGNVDIGGTVSSPKYTNVNNTAGTSLNLTSTNHSGSSGYGAPIIFGNTNSSGGNFAEIARFDRGSATFANGKAGFTKEGYLWCTTRRGDTVILDATSNGLASWVEYTPTSRIDDLRDKLDANRGDTGEMPADTQ